MPRNVESIYKKVTHKEHILLRPERHVGTVKPRTENTWLVDKESSNAKMTDVTYRPALIKLFDEIITNSVDFSKTPEGSNLTTINVDICYMSNCITVEDNGGISVVKHSEYGGWLPDMLFGELFSSSNYNEHDSELSNDTGAGQNGEGASLVNVFSEMFRVVTSDGKTKFDRTWSQNSNVWGKEKITKTSLKGTSISFIPDLKRFPEGNLRHDFKMMERRVYEVAACNPTIKLKLNGREIKVQDFTSFCKMFGANTVDDTDPKWSVGLFKSTNGFQHFSYVNSVQTRVGGAHVDYVMSKIVDYARPKLKRAYKTDYKPSFIKNVIGLVLVCEIKLPRFNGQTKEELTTTVAEFGSKWEPSKKFLEDSSKKIVEWFQSFHETLERQEEDKELDQIQKEAQQIKFYQIPKYSRATSKDRTKCKLFLTEGDCLIENTSVIVYGESGINEVQIKDINIGDLVLTHNNRLKPVINKFNKVSKCIEIETEKGMLSCSPTHKWFVYDNDEDRYYFIETNLLNEKKHSLVENLLTGVEYIENITKLEKGSFVSEGNEYRLKISFGDNDCIYSSNEHQFLVYDYKDMSYKMKYASELTYSHGMVSR